MGCVQSTPSGTLLPHQTSQLKFTTDARELSAFKNVPHVWAIGLPCWFTPWLKQRYLLVMRRDVAAQRSGWGVSAVLLAMAFFGR